MQNNVVDCTMYIHTPVWCRAVWWSLTGTGVTCPLSLYRCISWPRCLTVPPPSPTHSVNGKQYFECPDKYGLMVRPASVTVGDFPERDLMDDDDEM